MSVSDFYNSVTPGSSLSHGTGTGVYTIVETKDAASSTTYENEKLPMENKEGSSLLNEVKNFIYSIKFNYLKILFRYHDKLDTIIQIFISYYRFKNMVF